MDITIPQQITQNLYLVLCLGFTAKIFLMCITYSIGTYLHAVSTTNKTNLIAYNNYFHTDAEHLTLGTNVLLAISNDKHLDRI